jgi:hypothetical protein
MSYHGEIPQKEMLIDPMFDDLIQQRPTRSRNLSSVKNKHVQQFQQTHNKGRKSSNEKISKRNFEFLKEGNSTLPNGLSVLIMMNKFIVNCIKN